MQFKSSPLLTYQRKIVEEQIYRACSLFLDEQLSQEALSLDMDVFIQTYDHITKKEKNKHGLQDLLLENGRYEKFHQEVLSDKRPANSFEEKGSPIVVSYIYQTRSKTPK